MLLVREIVYCKPGKVRPMVAKFIAMDKLGRRAGMPKMRVMTDFWREWTIIAEAEVSSVDEFDRMMQATCDSTEDTQDAEGYHDLVDYERREIYNIEA